MGIVTFYCFITKLIRKILLLVVLEIETVLAPASDDVTFKNHCRDILCDENH